MSLFAVGLVLVALVAFATGVAIIYLQILLWAYIALGLVVLVSGRNHGN